jgi:hypothetical protein
MRRLATAVAFALLGFPVSAQATPATKASELLSGTHQETA